MRSIRSFLLQRLVLGAALVLGGAGVVLCMVATRSLEQQFDRNLSDRAESFGAMLFQREHRLSFEFSDELMPEYGRELEPAFFELRLASGEIVERSESLLGQAFPARGAVLDQAQHWTGVLPDGRVGRFVSKRMTVHHVYPEEGPDRPEAAVVEVVIARGRESLVAAERLVLLNTLLFSILIIALIAGLAWYAVGRGLDPLARLGLALDRVDVALPTGGLGLGALPGELLPVVAKTEDLMGRVDQALKRERRTTADIAHELRTPISELLTVAEVALREGRSPGAAVRALRVCRDVARRMGGSVATLLKLARLEMGAERFASSDVDLAGLVHANLQALGALVRERELDLSCTLPPLAVVRSDEDVLRIVVSNLLCNALAYSPVGGAVQILFEPAEPGWRLVVSNLSGGLRAADLESLAEPFWRKDRARVDRDHSGLGLTLSQSLAQRAGLALHFSLEAETFVAVLAPEGTLRSAPRSQTRTVAKLS